MFLKYLSKIYLYLYMESEIIKQETEHELQHSTFEPQPQASKPAKNPRRVAAGKKWQLIQMQNNS